MDDDVGPQPSAPPAEEGGWRTSLLVPVVIIAIVVGLIGAMIFTAQQDQDEGRVVLAATTVEPGTLPVTVPYRDVAGYIVIDVTFGDDSRTVPMVLDTGAPTIVSEEIAAVFAGEATGSIAGSSAAGQVVTSDVVPLPQLSIGDAVFHDVGAVVGAIEPGNPFYCVTDSGFVGASLMQAATWQIDPIAREVTIAASVEGLDHIDGAIRLPFERATDISPSPLIELPVGDGTLTILADTASGDWLGVNPEDLDGLGIEVPDEVPTMALLGWGGSGAFTTQNHWVSSDVTLTDAPEALPIFATEILPEGQGSTGSDFLSRFVSTYDWIEDVLYLEPVDELQPTTPASASLGWDEGYVVGSFVEGHPGNEELVLGAAVTALDGKDVTRAPFDDFCRGFLEPRSSYEMTVAGEVPMSVDVVPVEGFFEPLND